MSLKEQVEGSSTTESQFNGPAPAPAFRPPSAEPASILVTEDVPLSGLSLVGSDADGEPLRFSISTTPTKGKILNLDTATGRYTYSPNPNMNGVDSFRFRVTDPTNRTAEANVSVTIAPVADPPVVIGPAATVLEDGALTWGALPGEDPDGDSITFSILAGPLHGVIQNFEPATGVHKYVPAANYSGPDTYRFRVTDSTNLSTDGTVNMTVVAVNDAPITTPLAFSGVVQGVKFSRTLSATDVDNPTVTFSIVQNPSRGTLVLDNATTGAFSYTSEAGFSGADSFTYRVFDGQTFSNTATVSLTVVETVPELVTRFAGVGSVSYFHSPYVFTAYRQGSLNVFDVSRADSPIVATVGMIFYPADIAVSGNTLFLCGTGKLSGDPGLLAFDITQVSNPVLKKSLPGSCSKMIAADGQVYAQRGSKVEILDAELAVQGSFPGFNVNRLAKRGNLLYVLQKSSFMIYDVADPATPAQTFGTTDVGTYGAGDIEFLANDLALVNTWRGLLVFDTKFPATPVEIKTYDKINDVSAMIRVGNYLHIGTRTYDISNPQAIEQISQDGNGFGVSTRAITQLAGLYNENGYILQSTDLPQIGRLTVYGPSQPWKSNTNGVAAFDKKVFAIDASGLVTFGYADDVLVRQNVLPLEAVGIHLEGAGSSLYWASQRIVKIFDVLSGFPLQTKSLSVSETVYDLKVHGPYLFVAGLTSVQILDRTTLAYVGSYSYTGSAGAAPSAIAVSTDYLVIQFYQRGIEVASLANVANPGHFVTLSDAACDTRIALRDDLIVSSFTGEVRLFQILLNRTVLQKSAYRRAGDTASEILIEANRVFIGYRNQGIVELNISNISNPVNRHPNDQAFGPGHYTTYMTRNGDDFITADQSTGTIAVIR